MFDLLHRWEAEGTFASLPFEDRAEQRVLWDLTASLETLVDEVFDANFADVVAAARSAVGDKAE